ncbi:ABC transporter substrate-binding protein [Dethiobacter alkaliphilus]|nr:ABC transporter substrate-binding protein [Dethiobacter alkaliphilus]
MLKGRKFVLFVAVLLTLALVVVGCGDNGNNNADPDNNNNGDAEEIRIGTVGPLTGGAASYGVSVRRGVEIAINEANEAGGINGAQIRLIAEDTGGDNTEAANATSKLVEQDDVSVIIGAVLSSETFAGAPIANDAGVTMISPASTATGIPQEGEYIFRNTLADEVQAAQLAEYASDELGASRFAVMFTNNDYGVALRDAFVATAEGLGEVVAVESFMDGDSDFSAALTSIAQGNPEALFIGGYYEEAARIAQQAQEQGLDVQILGADGFYSPVLVNLGGDAVEGAIFTAAFYDGDTADAVVNFVSKFEEEFGETPDMFAA